MGNVKNFEDLTRARELLHRVRIEKLDIHGRLLPGGRSNPWFEPWCNGCELADEIDEFLNVNQHTQETNPSA